MEQEQPRRPRSSRR